MPLNKATGDMYPWVTHTWNPVQGRCPHLCTYCYMHRIWRLQGSKGQEFKDGYIGDNLGTGRVIFVGSSTDLFAGETHWIKSTINHCRQYPENTYLFQSKNPWNMRGWIYPPKTILGTTIETDDSGYATVHGNAPPPAERALALAYLRKFQRVQTMISIEPIMQFSLSKLVSMIRMCEPQFVSIGADSKGHHLPEPNELGVQLLIKNLRKFTKVLVKPNLVRIADAT